MELNNKQQSKGLGDTVAKITSFFGIDKVSEAIAKLAGLPGCGCEERREALNQLFPYESSIRYFRVKKPFNVMNIDYFKGQQIQVSKTNTIYHHIIRLVQDESLEEII
jgi:hypothetical protein